MKTNIASTGIMGSWLAASRKNMARGLSLALLGLSWQVLAQTDANSLYMETRQSGENARIEVLAGVYAAAQNVVESQTRLLIYRVGQSNNLPGATTIFVNEAYHTSLSTGGWSDLCMTPADVELGARQMRVGSQPRDGLDTITAVKGEGGKTVFLRVQEDTGRPVLQPVEPMLAQQELLGLRRQVHTISRVAQAQTCSLAPVTAQAPQQIQLSGDALFKFGRADFDGLTAGGAKALAELVQRLRADYADIERMNIIGHADPLGRPAANERLATERAATVQRFIERQDLQVRQMTSEGRGSTEPAVTGCPRMASPKAIKCHQPNRRVVIEIVGQRR